MKIRNVSFAMNSSTYVVALTVAVCLPGCGGKGGDDGAAPGAGSRPSTVPKGAPGAGSSGGVDAGGQTGSPTGTGIGRADGGGDPSVGCGQGTYCMAGSDIAPPDASEGFQFVSPSSISILPGGESFYCYYKNVPGTENGEVDLGGFKSWMTAQSSHHFITFLAGSAGAVKQADGALQTCAFGAGQWVYATSKSGMIVGMDMPDGVGLPMTSGAQLIMNMHLINTGDTPVSPVVKLNGYYAKNIKYKAASMASFNIGINVPPMGTQTVRGTCTPPAGSNFFLLTTHTHKFATAADINYVSGGQTTNLVHTTDWESPGTHIWQAPNFLTTKAGDTFTYSCTYQNPNSFAVTVGETAARNEMCMAIGYFFPQGTASCN